MATNDADAGDLFDDRAGEIGSPGPNPDPIEPGEPSFAWAENKKQVKLLFMGDTSPYH